MKRALKWMAIGVGVLLILAVAGLALTGGAMVKAAVNGVGPALMGVPVTLQDATLRPLSGKLELVNLHIGNPPGFKTPALLELGVVDVVVDVTSLWRKTLVIRKVAVVAPHITYERGLLDSNFGVLTKRLESEGRRKKEDPSAAGKGKKVIIEELLILDPTLNVSITAAGGHYMPVNLGRVELRNVGKEGGGVTAADALSIVFSVVTSNIENAARGVGDLIGSGVKAVGRLLGGGAAREGASTQSVGQGAFREVKAAGQ